MRSNYIASSSCLHLWSSMFVSGISSSSRSRSVSSRPCSISSTPTSSYSRSESSRPRSRSSSPSSLSLSISLGRSLPSPPSKQPTKATSASSKGYLENVPSPQSKQLLVEQKQQVESDANSKNLKQKGASVTVKDGYLLPSLKEVDEVKKESHGDDDGNHTKSRIGYEVTNLGTTSLKHRSFSADDSSSENSIDTRKPQKLQPLKHTESPSGELNLEVPVNSQTSTSTRISSGEMYMVLKHYGLALPEESEKNLPLEVFFGSARLWPWEII
ncbi:cell wall protein RBR3-like [Macadamia integrifolia]|uniref:cell wall protein RBR3-like n=1 Tax=Macadamia integrifolia TaxID=60698 RepID=UPI001C4E671F|nr:cell wall protein RBR3-like [Macadamia integrifolia]XP_042517332.1 cell wall protein RBR3-like [Macadamia integrifolia]